MRSPLLFAALLVTPLTLAACATGRDLPTYQEEMSTLEADCAARGGILTPSGRQTGRPQVDYVCKVSGGASRIQQN